MMKCEVAKGLETLQLGAFATPGSNGINAAGLDFSTRL
jgi:hypothetical protein